jgi:guanylate kinase
MASANPSNGRLGALFVVSGPSGVGKSTLLKAVFAAVGGLEFSVSATTRAPREGEVDGREYHFVNPVKFADLVDQGAFLEHAMVYDRRYGTLRAPVTAALAEGRSIVLDIDVLGARQVRAALPGAVLILIAPPDVATLRERLIARGTDGADVIESRMRQVADQLASVDLYDYLVVNDELDVAIETLTAVFRAELTRVARQGARVAAIHADLTRWMRPNGDGFGTG